MNNSKVPKIKIVANNMNPPNAQSRSEKSMLCTYYIGKLFWQLVNSLCHLKCFDWYPLNVHKTINRRSFPHEYN